MKIADISPHALYLTEATWSDTQPADNAAGTVTISAITVECWVVRQIDFSYDDPPSAAATLTVTAGGTTIYQIDITSGGAGQLHFPLGLHNSTFNEEVVITLLAGGSGIGGSLNVAYS